MLFILLLMLLIILSIENKLDKILTGGHTQIIWNIFISQEYCQPG